MDLKLIFLLLAAFFIKEVKKQIHLGVTVDFLYADTLAIEFNYNNTFDHINITSDEFDNFKVRSRIFLPAQDIIFIDILLSINSVLFVIYMYFKF